MTGLFLLLVLGAPSPAEPDWRAANGREAESLILARWETAGPDERRRMRAVLDRVEQARRFVDARNVLVDLKDGPRRVAELFEEILEPALAAPVEPESDREVGYTELHRRAFDALRALRKAYAAPCPVKTGTLNLLLGYAHAALTSETLPPVARLRFFVETLHAVRELEGRVEPDARTRWLIHQRLLPVLLGFARTTTDAAARESIAEAASLLYLPSILDAGAQLQLAPLTEGRHSRRLLLRAFEQGTIDDLGLEAMVRSVTLQAGADAAFASGAAPLFLELLCEPRLPPGERGRLVEVVLDRLAPVAPLRPAALDLLAAAFGEPPQALEAFREQFEKSKGRVFRPDAGRRYRFLSVVLLQRQEGVPPTVERVVRADVALHEAFHARDSAGRHFVGVLVPAAGGEHADFLGPPPGVGATGDNRLLRRTLRLERVALTTFGAHGEEIELCVALPDDESEPVPAKGANLGHVLRLVRDRLARTAEADERSDLLRFLVRVGTDAACRLAVEQADGSAWALMPLVDRGDEAAALAVLGGVEGLDLDQRERLFGAAVGSGLDRLVARVRELCGHEDVGVAALAADALLAHGDPSGIAALLAHPSRYARACGAALALRVSPQAGSLRVTPNEAVDLEALARAARAAFPAKGYDSWRLLGEWLGVAVKAEGPVRPVRSRKTLEFGGRTVSDAEFAAGWTDRIAEGGDKPLWGKLIAFVLSPADPGYGMREGPRDALLDALEKTAGEDAALREAWIDGLVLLACAQYGIEAEPEFGRLAQERLERIAGRSAPAGVRRKPGVFWPIWAARRAADAGAGADR